MKRWIAAAAGAGGAIFAALCCAGTPIIVSALAAAGLTFLRKDAILWPLMLISLVIALWGFWQGRTQYRNSGPLVVGTIAAVSIAAGVIFVHGPPAMEMIYGGALVLIFATLWNVRARRACQRPAS